MKEIYGLDFLKNYSQIKKKSDNLHLLTPSNRAQIRPKIPYFQVPALPPTDLGGISGIIDVDYKLRLRVDPPGYHWDLVVMVPIIIGTIPIQQFMGNFVNEGPVPPIEHFQKYPNIPAPRFSMMLGVKENDNGDFVHRYAIYNANTDGNNTKTDANDTKTDANDTKTDANNTKTDANNTKTDANNTDTDAKTINSEANKSNTDAKNTKTDAIQALADTIDNKSGDGSQVKTVAKQFSELSLIFFLINVRINE